MDPPKASAGCAEDSPHVLPALSAGIAEDFRDNKETPQVKDTREQTKSRLAAEFSGLAASKRDREGEKTFMADLARTLSRFDANQARKELANWGGRWVNRYRQDPEKAGRVLAELAVMVREGAIHRNAGAAADDLWRRFA